MAPTAGRAPADPDALEPLAPDTARALRRAVLDLRTHDRRRLFAPVLHVGRPGERAVAHGIRSDEHTDRALRTDVVAALLRRVGAGPAQPALVWLTRPGEHELHDVDADWLAAATAALAEAGLPVTRAEPMVVVTRSGWWDPITGRRRVWKRLRER